MSQIERIRAFLNGKGVNANLREDEDEILTCISTGIIGSRLLITERNGVLRCSILIPLNCPEYRRNEMADAMNRANWGLCGGSFRFDPADGELRYEAFLPVLDADVTDEQLRWLIWGAWTVSSRYAMALAEVAVSAATPADAIARAEASWQEESRELPVV
jgi:hypothetical protein